MAGQMDQKTTIVLAVVGSLGVLSAILGFSAEGTKLTHAVRYRGVCYYPPNPALGLGVCAIIFMIIAQVIFAVVGGCCGCCKSRSIPSETNKITGVVCAVASWIATVIAFALFVLGAYVSGEGWQNVGLYGACYVLKDGIFAGGAVLTLAATALGLTSYVLLRGQPAAAAVAAAAPNMGGGEQLPAGAVGIAMGVPQIPQKPRPQGSGQAPQLPQKTRPQGSGQAPQPYMGGGEQLPAATPGIAMGKPQKPRPQGSGQAPGPKYPKFTLRSQGNANIEHVYPEELRVEDNPQPDYQNESVIADLPEGEPQANGGEYFDGTAPTLSDLPEVDALASCVEYFDGADFKV